MYRQWKEISNLTAGRKMTARLQRDINWKRTDRNSSPLTNSFERNAYRPSWNSDHGTVVCSCIFTSTIVPSFFEKFKSEISVIFDSDFSTQKYDRVSLNFLGVIDNGLKNKLSPTLHSPLISHSHYSQEINNTSTVVFRLLTCLLKLRQL